MEEPNEKLTNGENIVIKSKGIGKEAILAIKCLAHFIFVVVVLLASAGIFAHLENFEEDYENRDLSYGRWFYFTFTTATTIGYGEITPQTTGGKVYFIFFSIFGVISMITLLIRCGGIICLINTKVCDLLQKSICEGCKRFVSEHCLSFFSLIFIFIIYLLIGIFTMPSIEVHYGNWESSLNAAYFWFATFSTVGFGDMYIPDEEVSVYVFYRFFGFCLIASIFVSFNAWMKKRKSRRN